MSSEAGSMSNTAEGYHALAKWYASRKQFKKAFEYLTKAQLHTDSLRSSEIVLQLKDLEETYKNEKREREITVLRKDQELQSLALSKERTLNTLIGIALISVVIISTLLINRYRVMNRIKRQLELEQMRQNISRDLHDDIGSALSSINILSKVAQVEKDGNTQNYLQRIGDQSARMMETMGDMVWSINPRNDSMEQVMVRMREFATEILDAREIEFEFVEKVTEGTTIDSEKRRNLFLIFKEAINNAAKYSNASLLKISLTKENNHLHLKVVDNGKGFDEATVKAGNGLGNLHERAAKIDGTLSIKSKLGKGTEVALQVPIA
jgi:signal transduction histidine kinase